jgi:hypothetical protein
VSPRFSVKKIVCGSGSGVVFGGDGWGWVGGWAAIV